MKFTSRKFILALLGTISMIVLIFISLFYRPELTIGLAGIMAGIIATYVTGNVMTNYFNSNI